MLLVFLLRMAVAGMGLGLWDVASGWQGTALQGTAPQEPWESGSLM